MHGRRRFVVAMGVGSVGAGLWLGRVHAERVVLPMLPLHGACLDAVGGWADLARGDLPDPTCRDGGPTPCCPPAAGACEPALMLADDADQPLPVRIVARTHAIDAGCPPQALAISDLTLAPRVRRELARRRIARFDEPWPLEELALHGLWLEALTDRAVLGDPDALDLTADLIQLDPSVRPTAVRAVGEDPGPGLGAALIEAAGRPERGPNQPPPLAVGAGQEAPPDTLDLLTGTGDATHALLAEASALRAYVGQDPDRLEAALFSPSSEGGAAADVHGALTAGGSTPGATALAALLAWGAVGTEWVPGPAGGVRLRAADREWWLDGCGPPRRTRPGDPAGVQVEPLALALAEGVGVWLRAGEVDRARAADRLLRAPGSGELTPPLLDAPAPPRIAHAPPCRLLLPVGRRGRSAALPVLPPPGPDPGEAAAALVARLAPSDLALAAWAAWRSGAPELARLLLRDPPADPWPRYAWRTVANALGELSDPAVRPTGCAPALWAGPL